MSELTDAEKERRWADMYRVIDDPLQWQREIDATGLSPNVRGSVRFWTTVAAYGLDVERDGVPECSRIVLALSETIGLELQTDDTTPFIRYRFVPLAEETP